jgi:transposase
MDAITPTEGCPGCAALAAEVAELRRQVAELKALLKRDSSNSSQPPSSDGPSAPPRSGKSPTGRRRGGQPGHRGHHRKLLPPERVDHVVRHLPRSCRHCHAPLAEAAGPHDPPPHRHQVAELPPLAAVITEHQGHARVCGCCGTVTRQPIPPPVLAHTLGPRLSALMSYLSGRCHDGRRVVLEFVNEVLGVPASLGTVCAREREMAAALEQACRQVSRVVRGAAAKNVDETGWKQAGKRRWLWLAAAKKAALFAIHPRRGWDGLRSVLGADPGRTGGGRGVVGCDRFPTYEPIPDRNRQLCWAHLLREFRKWSEPGGHSTAAMDMGEQGLGIAQRVLGLWRDFRARSPGPHAGRRTLRRKASELKKGLAALLRRGSRLRAARDLKAARFCAKVLVRRESLWTFLRAPGVEPTNNHAERCLRPAVLWRKNSFGCASDGGCRFAERILTVVTTLRLRGQRVLDYLQRTLECHRAELPAPSIFA